MPISFQCDCGQTLRTADEHAGRSVTCPKCRARLTVPLADAVALRPGPPPPAAAPVSRALDDRPRTPPAAVPAAWLLEAGRGRCESCGIEAPTKQTSFNQHIGAVILMFHREVKGQWCKRCIHQKYWTTTLITLFFGWWGLISVFVTPIVLIANLVRYLGSLGLDPPPDARRASAAPPGVLKDRADEIVERIREGQPFEQLVHEVAEPEGAGRSQLAAFLVQLVMQGRLTIEERPAGRKAAPAGGLLPPGRPPPSGRTVGPGVGLAIVGAFNLLWIALFTPLMFVITDTNEPLKGAAPAPANPAPADPDQPKDRRPLTPEELANNHMVGLVSAGVNGPVGLLLVLGGVQTARRRWYPLAVVSSLVAMIPIVTVCCVGGLPVGYWSLVVLLNADVRATFT